MEPWRGLPGMQAAILDWYAARARPLSFRATTDPYAILVSEVMAQQTQAARAGASWTGFMTRFPTVGALAAASPADVLRAWQGLGYNRRALNLRDAARRIVADHAGRVPSDVVDLQSLPGVGPYTARAVAALAYGSPVGAVDTNVRRVLGRIVAGEDRAMTSAAVQEAADRAVPSDRPADWTHALMDIGAQLCRPAHPKCIECPARPWCAYARRRSTGAQPARVTRSRGSGPSSSFASTSRWLRGQIVARCRAITDAEWVLLQDAIGAHRPVAVVVAARALAREGLLEVEAEGHKAIRVRLAQR